MAWDLDFTECLTHGLFCCCGHALGVIPPGSIEAAIAKAPTNPVCRMMRHLLKMSYICLQVPGLSLMDRLNHIYAKRLKKTPILYHYSVDAVI